MEFRTAPIVKRFSTFERQEALVLDSSRIKEFKRCPFSYFLKYVLNRVEDKNVCWLVWGTAYHKFREVLELEYKKHLALDPNKKAACELSMMPAMDAARASWMKALEKGEIHYPAKKYAFYTLGNLLGALPSAFVWWEREKLGGNIEVLEVEFPFSIQLPNGEFIGGRGDQLIRAFGKKQGRDFKSTGTRLDYYGNSLLPNLQFGLYTFGENALAGDVNGQTIEAFFFDDKGKPELRGYPILYTSAQLREIEAELIYTVDEMSRARENDMYRKNESACYFCEYRPVCQSSSETAQTSLLKLKYKHKIWDSNAKEE